MPDKNNRILAHQQIQSKIKRMAYQILENNLHEQNIYLAGIKGGGSTLAKLLQLELTAINSIETVLIEVSIDKEKPLSSPVTLNKEIENPENSIVILIDDVLNSGKTMAYALKPFLAIPLKKIETAFLVNRSHRLFPISAKYTGIELATTIQEHINVSWKENDYTVFLV
ncbi:phosphoribosyltransferase [Marivirga sp. S37H4]|uniref:Phosphoribosyltransferase n=1 Tax=Marivirga aurantiaca TaxID=2802615 RepID=A0A934WX50_9BACT|nr:phosphoribosyltransferase family protein [Marivirga aurantiaca]MBK6264481.1 phosphoribosyltransferase [Marivirga aurantiaca]